MSVLRVMGDEGSGRMGRVVSLHLVGSQCSGWELFASYEYKEDRRI